MIDLIALDSLRAIEAHGSVVAAADALGFTPSAVSQQVKRLGGRDDGAVGPDGAQRVEGYQVNHEAMLLD